MVVLCDVSAEELAQGEGGAFDYSRKIDFCKTD